MHKEKREHVRKHIDKKLTRRLKMYAIISLIIIGIELYYIITGGIERYIAIGLFMISILLGIIFSRMFSIFRDDNVQQVVSRIDTIGWFILGFYILFSIARQYILNSFAIESGLIFGATFSIVAGLMLGRVLGMKKKIVKVLKEEGILG